MAVDPRPRRASAIWRRRLLPTAVVAILLLGLGLRVGFAWEGRAPVFDAAAYARIAANLERDRGFTLGEGATQPASNYSPGVPLLAAGLYELSGGDHERFARLVLALIGALSVLFAYLIGRRLAGPTAGLVGAAAVAVYPALLEYQGMLMGEPLAATLLSGAVLAMLWATGPADAARGSCRGGPPPCAQTPLRGAFRYGGPPPPRHPRERWLVPGMLLGALALVRPEHLGIGVLLGVVVLALYRDRWRAGVANAALLLTGVALVVAPWTIRNAIALDRFVPVSTGGGQVLFAGSYMPSGGDPEKVGRKVLERHPGLTRRLAAKHLPPSVAGSGNGDGGLTLHSGRNPPPTNPVLAHVRLEQILAALAAQRYPDMETDKALARMGRERLWNGITDEPLDYAGFVVAKVWRIWSQGPRSVMDKAGWAAFHAALVVLGLLGLALLAQRRHWEILPIAVVLLAATAVGALLVASPRRVLAMIPLVAPLAGTAAVWLGSMVHRQSFDESGPI